MSSPARESKIGPLVGTVAGIALLIVLGLAGGISSWLSIGEPTVPQLHGWWDGYRESAAKGREYCVALFFKDRAERQKMDLLCRTGPPEVFEVDQNSSQQGFVHLTFRGEDRSTVIKAKQLYYGERYAIERLIEGRFTDFWKLNHDITVRGEYVSASPHETFAVEPINENQVGCVWYNVVRPDRDGPTPGQVINDAQRGDLPRPIRDVPCT